MLSSIASTAASASLAIDSHAVLVGVDARDDAGVVVSPSSGAIAVTLDVGTPTSNDPRIWGRVAAENCLSDCYAMGAVPFAAVALVGWPATEPTTEIKEALAAATEQLTASSTHLIGGHTLATTEPLLGFSVTASIEPDRMMLLENARPGHVLILSKPLGNGIAILSNKVGIPDAAALIRESERLMLQSNRIAASLALDAGCRAAIDVTGDGLIGHLHRMLKASGVAATINAAVVPAIPDVLELLTAHGLAPNSAEINLFGFEPFVTWNSLSWAERILFSDPQTNGGLLFSVDPSQASRLLDDLSREYEYVAVIGSVTDGIPGTIDVTTG
jgi:selenide,water dikinase